MATVSQKNNMPTKKLDLEIFWGTIHQTLLDAYKQMWVVINVRHM